MSQLDFGIIGNCQISALVDKSAKIVWCCMPRFDAPAIFASLLDAEKGGFWSIESAQTATEESPVKIKQSYLRNTNVLSTRMQTQDGSEFEVIDFMPRFSRGGSYYKPVQIVRILKPIKGIPKIVVRCRPVFNYGKEEPVPVNLASQIKYESAGHSLYLASDASLTYILNEVPFELRESKHFVLTYGEPFQGTLKFDIEEHLDRTLVYWRSWVKQCSIPFEFQEQVIRSALVLKLHIYEDTGAIIAAATTSIPEGPNSGRNWDYRFCWLRDAYFVVTALNRLGQFEEMEQFIGYLQNICASEESGILQPVYGIGGEKELLERELPWLNGFKGNGPVRVGNAAYKMDQHDVYGEMVMAITPTFFDRRLDKTDQESAVKSVRQLIDQAIKCFELPDAGIWEFRGVKKHSVFTKLMNWAAVDRGIRIAKQLGKQEWANELEPVLGMMRSRIEKEGWSESAGFYSQSYGTESPDAANLLLGWINFASNKDERFKKTVLEYNSILRTGKGVYRYRTADDFGIPETTFTVCSFWLADALWGIGKKSEARELFLSVIQQANHVGLLSEDMDPQTGELWGNFPQTYSHVGLINTAMRISQSWDDAF